MGDTQQNKHQWDSTFKCDKCGETFTGREVLIEKEHTGFECFNPMQRRIMVKHKNENYDVLCPLCKKVHLFGFDIVRGKI